jgi:hypothetical protein
MLKLKRKITPTKKKKKIKDQIEKITQNKL